MTDTPSPTDSPFTIPQGPPLDRRDDAQFQHEIKRLIETAEEVRLKYMNQHQLYKMIGMTVGLIILLAGATGFGWFFLMEPDFKKAIASLIVAVSAPLLLHGWVRGPVNAYLKDYKGDYLPQLANLIGGFSYHPTRGVSEKILRRTGVVPPYKHYDSEDCFRGHYKGTKVLFSEAKLRDDKKNVLFRGLFVLMEIPHKVFEGHTIITADRDMAENYADERWRKLQKIPLHIQNPEWNQFVAYSDKPEENALILGDALIKELAEANIAFNNDSPLSAVLFNGKYVFMMIPHEKDMFEAFDLYVPISTDNHALACKKEIEQLLEVVDVFDLYAPRS